MVIAPPCRACGGSTLAAFTIRLLERYDVGFYRCEQCHSLESEQPYWLNESYAAAISITDTGAVERNLIGHAAIVAVAKIFGLQGRFVDYGGGAGMLCRLLRDSGIDAYLFDRYAEPVYARAFALQADELDDPSPALVSAIEVLEHCENPAQDVGRLFALRPQVLIATTIPYRGEGSDWWYLSPDNGQHIFFYSQECLQMLAHKHGFDYLGVGAFHLFAARRITAWERLSARILLSRMGLRFMRVWISATQRGGHADEDNAILRRRLIAERRDSSKSQ
jgi:hypothetical protein